MLILTHFVIGVFGVFVGGVGAVGGIDDDDSDMMVMWSGLGLPSSTWFLVVVAPSLLLTIS